MTTLQTLLAFNAFIWLCSAVAAGWSKDSSVMLIPAGMTIACGFGWMLMHHH